ncbi:galactose-3-O-sulfotransferase 2 [Gouania willdenowi]|uniref:Galactose-3-O-sulfotransferase 2-like n=1 Tax=Gouania willdenowi TaxID=441366 RepID=A0A8C5ERB9_GOUWI|nr:galactose-3-O-sulfotransferase 2-like [Gouania willdenowi]
MPLLPRRGVRCQPLSAITPWMCSRRYSIWFLLILLVVCAAIQTFVAHLARNEKLNGLPYLSQEISTLPNALVGINHKSSLALQEESRSKHMERTADLHHQYKRISSDGSLKGSVAEMRSLAASLQAETKNGLTDQMHLPKLDIKGSLSLLLLRHNERREPHESNKEQTFKTYPASAILKTTSNNVYTKESCQPKSHIVFLKTHKTASSSILNILYRYGESRNLSFALPLNKHSQLFYPFFFASHFVEGVSSRRVSEFHIMCNHMRFSKSEVAKVMPTDSFYFSILRNPVAMMESIFNYYKSIPAFQKAHSLDNFLDNSWKMYNTSLTNNHYAHNILAFDFGFDNNVTARTDDFEERTNMAIAGIEQDFDLILISEYFDESMILLKHALCWSLEDIVSFRLNSRSEHQRRNISPDTAEKVKQWNVLDWKIYLHFNKTFWHQVNSLVGIEHLKKELSQLRALRAKLANTCLKDGHAVDPSEVKDTRLKPFQYGAAVIQGYNLNPDLNGQSKLICQRLITPELQYTDLLYTKQFPEKVAKQRQATKMVASQHQRLKKTSMMKKLYKREANQRHIRNDPNIF